MISAKRPEQTKAEYLFTVMINDGAVYNSGKLTALVTDEGIRLTTYAAEVNATCRTLKRRFHESFALDVRCEVIARLDAYFKEVWKEG